MKTILPACALGFVLLTSACNRSDEGLAPVVTPGAANLILEAITSERKTFTVGASCPNMPTGSTIDIQVITITARVDWLGTGTCEGGFTKRECRAGNLDEGTACTVDSDCDLSAPGDMSGTCGKHPCQFDEDCAQAAMCNGSVCPPDSNCAKRDTCGTVASRLVFASALVDPKTLTEIGVTLFDNGTNLMQYQSSGGTPVTGVCVRTGDASALDRTYTRKFGVFASSTAGQFENCIAKTIGVTPVPFGVYKNVDLLFRIDAIDAITGAARLTTVNASTPIRSEPTCCKIKSATTSTEACNSTDCVCNPTNPACM